MLIKVIERRFVHHRVLIGLITSVIGMARLRIRNSPEVNLSSARAIPTRVLPGQRRLLCHLRTARGLLADQLDEVARNGALQE